MGRVFKTHRPACFHMTANVLMFDWGQQIQAAEFYTLEWILTNTTTNIVAGVNRVTIILPLSYAVSAAVRER